MQYALAGEQDRNGLIVAYVLTGVRKLTAGFFGHGNDEIFRHYVGIPGGRLQDLVIGQNETVVRPRPDRMANGSFPHHGAVRAGTLVAVFHGGARFRHAPHCNKNRLSGLRKGGVLGTKEAEGIPGPDGAEKGVQKHGLIIFGLHPATGEAQVFVDLLLGLLRKGKMQIFGDAGRLVGTHPPERDAGGRIGGLIKGGGIEMGEDGAPLGVGMVDPTFQVEGGEEGPALGNTRGQVFRRQIAPAAPAQARLPIVVPHFVVGVGCQGTTSCLVARSGQNSLKAFPG
jgi:hypothetical protein